MTMVRIVNAAPMHMAASKANPIACRERVKRNSFSGFSTRFRDVGRMGIGAGVNGQWAIVVPWLE